MFKLQNTIFKILIEIFVLSKNKRAELKGKWAKKHLQKYINIALSEPLKPVINDECNIIWQYWHQGIENAPEIIKKCLASVKRCENDKVINVLTLDTIKNYIELPQRYYDLVNSGKMPIALFSDVLRVYLLEKYGGTWIDATSYLSGKIPQDILDADFFGFQNPPDFVGFTGNKTSCYFLHSKKQSKNIQVIRRTLDAYWKENDFMFNYFMFEHIETMLMDKTPELKKEWDKMPYYPRIYSGLRGIVYKKLEKLGSDDTDDKVINYL